MTILAPAKWRIRQGGSTLNGGGFDDTSYGPGVDFSDQDAPQLSLTDIVGNGTTTITSATGGFTTQGITRGNYLNLTTAPGGTVGFYPITSVTDNNTVVLGRTPGTFTGGVGRVGGAWGGSATNPFSISGPVAGNTVFVRGSGTDTPSSADYTFAGFSTSNSGSVTGGRISFVGYNGRPRLHGNGLIWFNVSWVSIVNMYAFATGTNAIGNGLISFSGNGLCSNVFINTNNQSGAVGLSLGSGSLAEYCEVVSGVTNPTSSSGANGIITGSPSSIVACVVRFARGFGMAVRAGDLVSNCIVHGCVSDGINLAIPSNAGFVGGGLFGNTIHGNGGHGINHAGGQVFLQQIRGNILSGHTGSGRCGINVAAGTSALVDALRAGLERNSFWNNTAHRSANLSASVGDVTLTADPYTNAASNDFRLNATTGGGAALRGVGFPHLVGTFPQSTGGTRVGFPDVGAYQHQDTGGSGSSSVSGARIFTGF